MLRSLHTHTNTELLYVIEGEWAALRSSLCMRAAHFVLVCVLLQSMWPTADVTDEVHIHIGMLRFPRLVPNP